MSWNHHILYFQLRSRSSVEERRGVLVCCLWLGNDCWEVSVVIVRWRAGDWHIESLQVLTATNTAGGREEGTVILLECGPTLDWWTSSSLSSARPAVVAVVNSFSLSVPFTSSWAGLASGHSPPWGPELIMSLADILKSPWTSTFWLLVVSWVHLHQSGERCDLSQVSLTGQNW